MKAMLRSSLATLVGSVALFVAPSAFAEGEPCINDVDCPGGGQVCGGDVCNWTKPQGDKFTCNAAGTQTPKGKDGWCTTTADCKCKGEGATCVAPYCTFTKASDAPAGTGGTGTGGSASTGGTTAAGTTSTAGTTSAAGTAAKPADDGGGCSVGVPGGANTGIALGVGLLGLGLAFARRRR